MWLFERVRRGENSCGELLCRPKPPPLVRRLHAGLRIVHLDGDHKALLSRREKATDECLVRLLVANLADRVPCRLVGFAPRAAITADELDLAGCAIERLEHLPGCGPIYDHKVTGDRVGRGEAETNWIDLKDEGFHCSPGGMWPRQSALATQKNT